MTSLRRGALALLLALALAPAADARTYPWLGVRIRDLSEQEMEEIAARHGIREGFGVYIVDVIEGAPAQRAGLQRGDIVVAVNGRPVVETRLLQRLVASAGLDKDVRLTILRPDGRQQLGVRLAIMPSAMAGERTAADFGFVLRDPEAAGQPPARALDPLPPGAPAVVAVLKGSPAERAGLSIGDVIVEVEGRSVATGEAAREALAAAEVTRPLRLTVRRDGEPRSLTLAAP
jgi:serine protease Do